MRRGVVDDTIEAADRRVTDHPNTGRPGRVAGIRALAVTGTPPLHPIGYMRSFDTASILASTSLSRVRSAAAKMSGS